MAAPLTGSNFTCDGNLECEGATLICDDNTHCFVYCGAWDSGCRWSTIHAPNRGDLDIICTGDWPHEAMRGANISAPLNGNLKIVCNGELHFQGVALHAGHMVNGSLFLQSAARYTAPYEDTAIYLPRNGVPCTIHCGFHGCYRFTFYSKPDTKLYITATDTDALSSSHVYCPTGDNGTCSITTTGSNAGMLSGVTIYSVRGFQGNRLLLSCKNSIVCHSDILPIRIACGLDYRIMAQISLTPGYNNTWEYSSGNHSDICTADTPSGYYGNVFHCMEWDQCNGLRFVCNNNENCSVYCGTWGCQYTSIHGPREGDLNIMCIRDGMYPIRKPMRGAQIISPLNGNVNIHCGGHSFMDVTVNASHMIQGSVFVNITAARVNIYEDTTIYCPGNGIQCVIHCGLKGCYRFRFHTKPDSQLYITAVGEEALTSSHVHCPTGNDGICSIHASGNGSNMFNGATIYTKKGLNDSNLYLSCEYTSGLHNCYQHSNPIQMFYGSHYNTSCTIALRSCFDDWMCVDGSTEYLACNSTKYQTIHPSKYPSISPSIATYPTISSSKYTTVDNAARSTALESSVNNATYADEPTMDDISNYIIWISIAVCAVCAIAVIGYLVFKFKKQKEEIRAQTNPRQYMIDIPLPNSPKQQNNIDRANCVEEKENEGDMVHEERAKKNTLMLKAWLLDIELPQYYALLVESGYESLGFVKDISNKAQLEEIGICKPGHQTRIMKAITALNDNYNAEMDSEGMSPERLRTGNKITASRGTVVASSQSCKDCGKQDFGMIYDGDGLFYCNECWMRGTDGRGEGDEENDVEELYNNDNVTSSATTGADNTKGFVSVSQTQDGLRSGNEC